MCEHDFKSLCSIQLQSEKGAAVKMDAKQSAAASLSPVLIQASEHLRPRLVQQRARTPELRAEQIKIYVHTYKKICVQNREQAIPNSCSAQKKSHLLSSQADTPYSFQHTSANTTIAIPHLQRASARLLVPSIVRHRHDGPRHRGTPLEVHHFLRACAHTQTNRFAML